MYLISFISLAIVKGKAAKELYTST